MGFFKKLFYFLLLLLVCEFLALSAVSWSFAESVRGSFATLTQTTDLRARDTLSGLNKASESRIQAKSYPDLNLAFAILKKRVLADKESFPLEDIVLLSPHGVVLGHTNPEKIASDVTKRKPDPDYESAFFKKANRMRKWQLSEPIVLKTEPVLGKNEIQNKILGFFPELKKEKILISSAVYHNTKLDVEATLHFIYWRGDYQSFWNYQWAVLEWMLQTYSGIAFASALVLFFFYLLLVSSITLSVAKRSRKITYYEGEVVPGWIEKEKKEMIQQWEEENQVSSISPAEKQEEVEFFIKQSPPIAQPTATLPLSVQLNQTLPPIPRPIETKQESQEKEAIAKASTPVTIADSFPKRPNPNNHVEDAIFLG